MTAAMMSDEDGGKFQQDQKKLDLIQQEQIAWVHHNFGNRPASQPLRGIVEELGELDDSVDKGDREEIKDSIADTVIFMSDYCSAMNINLGYIFSEGVIECFRVGSLIRLAGDLCHNDLKLEQGIRSVTKDDVEVSLMNIMSALYVMAKGYGFDLVEITRETWDRVKKRDWKKDSQNAGQ